MRKVYIIPNLFTAASLFCGLLAILEIADGWNGALVRIAAGTAPADPGAAPMTLLDPSTVERACLLILLAGFFDILDGLIARLTRTQSPFGLNFDSLSDAISFGAAPAVLAYLTVWPDFERLAKATCGLYVICGAMRLARFNVQAAREEKKQFLGLPIPAAACSIVSLMWVYARFPAVGAVLPPAVILPVALVILAALMVSVFPYYSLKNLALGKRQPFEILVSIVVMISILLALKQYVNAILAAGCLTYALSGPAVYLHRRRKGVAGRGAAVRASRRTGAPRSTSPPPTP